jgi:hypothetical protein
MNGRMNGRTKERIETENRTKNEEAPVAKAGRTGRQGKPGLDESSVH